MGKSVDTIFILKADGENIKMCFSCYKISSIIEGKRYITAKLNSYIHTCTHTRTYHKHNLCNPAREENKVGTF